MGLTQEKLLQLQYCYCYCANGECEADGGHEEALVVTTFSHLHLCWGMLELAARVTHHL